jgi:hypothetical protein
MFNIFYVLLIYRFMRQLEDALNVSLSGHFLILLATICFAAFSAVTVQYKKCACCWIKIYWLPKYKAVCSGNVHQHLTSILRLDTFLPTYLITYLIICLSIYLSIYLSIVYLHIYLNHIYIQCIHIYIYIYERVNTSKKKGFFLELLTLEDGKDGLARNVCTELTHNTA